MHVRVRLFAALRERAGAGELDLELPDDARVADAIERLGDLVNGVPVVMAVNHEYAGGEAQLHAGDELALIPPVSGGETTTGHVRITTAPIELDPLLALVRDPRAGAVVSFLGVTREVGELHYEAYAEMAEKEMAEIVRAAMERHGLCAAAAEHRVGVVPLSEPSVAIAASAPHREAAFAGAREIIDQIKARAPIWKGGGGMGAGRDTRSATLRELPAVHELAASIDAPHALGVEAARRAIDEQRAAVLAGRDSDHDRLLERARELASELSRMSLRRVINATGVVVHTNLGRAPLAQAAREAVLTTAQGYGNLEMDLEHGERGSRQLHTEGLLRQLTGAETALVVNNGAAAVLLAVAALAGPGRAVVVSRGQLVEIGGGFRIPEVVAQSGARLVEVGTTNRTRLSDYRAALAGSEIRPAAILRVHPSNFRALGFVEDVPVAELCTLGVPVIDDVGSGVLADPTLAPALAEEPSIRESVQAGAAIVCCSGDKLLGGPQAGVMVGRHAAVDAARRHPLARAMRIDKLSLAALEATLRLYREPERARREIPVLAMLDAAPEELEARAGRLAAAIGGGAEVVRCSGKVGGGALPLLELDGYAVALPGEPMSLAGRLRVGDPPVICRIRDERALLDVRTVDESELDALSTAARAALGPPA